MALGNILLYGSTLTKGVFGTSSIIDPYPITGSDIVRDEAAAPGGTLSYDHWYPRAISGTGGQTGDNPV